jgi:hypothetical protein
VSHSLRTQEATSNTVSSWKNGKFSSTSNARLHYIHNIKINMENLMASVRVRQGANVLGTPILTLSYDHTPDQVFHLWNQQVKRRKMATPLKVYGMEYDAQNGDQQWSDLSAMNELEMEMTI